MAGRSRLDILTAWTFLTPVFGIILAAVVFGERPAGWTAVGLVAVLAAMWVVLRPVSAWRSARRGGGQARGPGSQLVRPSNVEEER